MRSRSRRRLLGSVLPQQRPSRQARVKLGILRRNSCACQAPGNRPHRAMSLSPKDPSRFPTFSEYCPRSPTKHVALEHHDVDLTRVLLACAKTLSHEKRSVYISAPPKVMIDRSVAVLTT